MILKIADLSDIEQTLELHYKYQIDSINEDDKKDGFVTTAFTKEQLSELITKEQGLFIAVENDKVIAYIMAASWRYWSAWPMFEFMMKDLGKLEYMGQKLSVDNTYQYGPTCIYKSVRGTGVLEKIFNFSIEHMSKKYPILITFINKINPRSYEAHKRKMGFDVIQEFTYNNNDYYELAYDTSKTVKTH
ncbi:MAG: GNAT family acetyltransferase [Sulfurimonas sp.]|nr:MAG: GNAT family acetyltransferase [Sulfurimonas sp.]